MISTKRQFIFISAVAIAGSLLYFYLNPSYSRLFPPCVFHKLTGLYCPGCGSQRAFHDLLHGDLLQALGHNALFMAFLPVIGFAALVAVNNIFFAKKMGQDIFYSPWFTRIVLAAVVGFWVLRNIPLAPFSRLAP